MKQWIEWLLQNKYRRLNVSVGGRWYLAFTILLGVVAINSGNNVIYLLESLLLSALILSGVLSEQTLIRVKIQRVVSQAKAKERTGDIIIVENTGRFPLYCIEFGEWSQENFISLGFILVLPARAKIRIKSNQVFSQRGKHSWDKLAVATSFPFGFAQKIRFFLVSGSRIIWPEEIKGARKPSENNLRKGSEQELIAGEIEEIPSWGDISRVHWPSSGRASSLMAIPRGRAQESAEVEFFPCEDAEELERRIKRAAFEFKQLKTSHTLVIKDGVSSKKILGKTQSMNFLSLMPQGNV